MRGKCRSRRARPGRRNASVLTSKAGRLAIGIDVGGTKALGILVNLDAPADVRRVSRRATPVPSELSVDPSGAGALLDVLVEIVVELDAPAAPVGVGLPGLITTAGTFRYGPNLPGVVEAPIAERLADRIGRPVFVDNDANNAALAEFAIGAGAGYSDGVLITMGTGIGAGLVVGGAIVRGANGFAAEPGHATVVVGGVPCPCGRFGCWERYASGSALGRLGIEAGSRSVSTVLPRGEVSGEDVVAAARRHDAAALAAIDEFCGWVALGVGNLIATLDPGVVVLGGGVIDAADLVVERVRASVEQSQFGAGHRPAVPILAAALGARAGAIGSALSTAPSV